MWSPLCRCLKALKAYKAIKGSLKVPSKYVVPNDVSYLYSPWRACDTACDTPCDMHMSSATPVPYHL